MTAQSEEGWTADDRTFGARLALIRQHKGWGNVKEAALACRIPVESWRTWERDGVEPRNYLAVVEQISANTRCDYGWLRDGRPSGAPFDPKTRPRLGSNQRPTAYNSHRRSPRALQAA